MIDSVPVIDPATRAAILGQLAAIEAEEQVRIVYACESGSRAWGFASTDSDYDVRFIYTRPADWYLSILERPDVIERPLRGQFDLSGWDLRKALQLYRKSNPPLLEWLGSPIIYHECDGVAARLRALLPEYYSPAACMHHYYHMAAGNYRDYLKGEHVWVKKYLYVLRPLLAVLWIERGLDPVPTAIDALVRTLVADPALLGEINDLLAEKRAGVELATGSRRAYISAFLEREFARIATTDFAKRGAAPPAKPLDELLRDALRWHATGQNPCPHGCQRV